MSKGIRVTSQWLDGLNSEQRELFEQKVIKAKPVLDKLAVLCKKQIRASETARHSLSTYESPAWSERQADSIGYRRAYEEMITLLTLIEEDING
jgi:hypothetical protein